MGVEDLFARPGYREFYLDIADGPQCCARSRMSAGSTSAPRSAATNLGLTFRDCYYLILSSYDDGEIARFGPGRAHLHELLRHAIERGFRKFDFTVGDEPYKRDWSDIEVRLYDHLDAVDAARRMVVAANDGLPPHQALHQADAGAVARLQQGRGVAATLGLR